MSHDRGRVRLWAQSMGSEGSRNEQPEPERRGSVCVIVLVIFDSAVDFCGDWVCRFARRL